LPDNGSCRSSRTAPTTTRTSRPSPQGSPGPPGWPPTPPCPARHRRPPVNAGAPVRKATGWAPSPQIAARATWKPFTVHRYGQKADVHLSEQIVQWYGPWKDLPVRLILLRDTAKYYNLAQITTDLHTPAEQIISAYAARWSIEVVFAQMRQLLGVGQARNRTARAVERTIPFGLSVCTLIIL
jgi:hypothetical protein